LTHLTHASIAKAISINLDKLEKLNLTVLEASRSDKSIDNKVREGFAAPEEQAEPAEA
jgi:hypothetical protein